MRDDVGREAAATERVKEKSQGKTGEEEKKKASQAGRGKTKNVCLVSLTHTTYAASCDTTKHVTRQRWGKSVCSNCA